MKNKKYQDLSQVLSAFTQPKLCNGCIHLWESTMIISNYTAWKGKCVFCSLHYFLNDIFSVHFCVFINSLPYSCIMASGLLVGSFMMSESTNVQFFQ